MNDFPGTIRALCEGKVRFVVIGGVAASAHGSRHLTFDLDLCYDRGRDNIECLAKALEPFHPRLRGVREDLPFSFDAPTVAAGMNFTLTTDLGDIDLLGEVTGMGGYKEAKALSVNLDLFGLQCPVLSLDGLIQSKRAAARPKDLLTLPEIEVLREMETQRNAQSGPVGAPRGRHIGDNRTKT